MLIPDVTVQVVKSHARIDTDSDDTYISGVIMPAALEHLKKMTGLPDEKINTSESLTIAFLALCADMYDNRSALTDTGARENKTVKTIVYGNAVNYIA